jgi:hypothetical protein
LAISDLRPDDALGRRHLATETLRARFGTPVSPRRVHSGNIVEVETW